MIKLFFNVHIHLSSYIYRLLNIFLFIISFEDILFTEVHEHEDPSSSGK